MMLIQQFTNGLHNFTWQDVGICGAIVVMDAAFSGDNSIAIGAMVQNLPEKIRSKAVWCGMVVAAIFRVIALGLAAFIASNPWVQCLGAFYLFYLVIGHFSKSGEEEAGKSRKQYKSFFATMVAIGGLDMALSADNVIAVVAMSKNFAVIVIGVLISIAMLAVASQAVRKEMKHYPSLEHAAYLILAFLGVMMLAEHGAETIVWAGHKIAAYNETISSLQYKIGDMGQILVVVGILVATILKEEIGRRHHGRQAVKPAKSHVTVTQ